MKLSERSWGYNGTPISCALMMSMPLWTGSGAVTTRQGRYLNPQACISITCSSVNMVGLRHLIIDSLATTAMGVGVDQKEGGVRSRFGRPPSPILRNRVGSIALSTSTTLCICLILNSSTTSASGGQEGPLTISMNHASWPPSIRRHMKMAQPPCSLARSC